MDDASPFHAGEITMQERAGVRAQVDAIGRRVIRDHMPDAHRELFGRLPSLVVGSVDALGLPWASMLAGRPGFVSTPDARTMRVGALPRPDDPLAAQLAPGAPLGLLGIEPATRRRNRMNGSVIALDAAGFDVSVEQSFGNCPQYIQARTPEWVDDAGTAVARVFELALPAPAIDLVLCADTLFVATAARRARLGGASGVDVSHRGGRPGFVHHALDPDGRSVLTLPDFRGNNLFNTLGNIVAHPYAGLLFFDPVRGDVVQLTGSAEVIWDGAALASFAGAQRLLQIVVEQGRWAAGALPLRWSAPGYAAQLRGTGVWDSR
jgi:uncharacterized protein